MLGDLSAGPGAAEAGLCGGAVEGEVAVGSLAFVVGVEVGHCDGRGISRTIR